YHYTSNKPRSSLSFPSRLLRYARNDRHKASLRGACRRGVGVSDEAVFPFLPDCFATLAMTGVYQRVRG
ncbi:MAG TPA: hypothetical protein VMW13_11340, partial [Dehalococcoidales bacterium]|nr:hypothetical protein [Dehalococcoidales bacterium]